MGKSGSKFFRGQSSRCQDSEENTAMRMPIQTSSDTDMSESCDMELLTRFLFLGSENTFNDGGREPWRQFIDRLIRKGKGKEVVELISELGGLGRTPVQDYIILTLALCARSDDLATKELAYKSLSKVCRIPPHLFLFLSYCKQECGNHGKGWGRAHKSAVIKWYMDQDICCGDPINLGRLLTKYKRWKVTRNHMTERWDHKDVFRLVHPPQNNKVHGMKVMLRYVMRGLKPADDLVKAEMGENKVFSLLLSYLEGTEKARRCENEDDLVKLIELHKLEREHVLPQMMRSEKVCKAVFMNMTPEDKLRKLCLISSKNLCKADSEVEKEIVRAIKDPKSGRIHPLRILSALLSYETGARVQGKQKIKWEINSNISKALNNAFYLSFRDVESTDKQFLLAINVSQEMKIPCVGSKTIRCDQAAAAMMMLTVRTKSKSKILAFDQEVVQLRIEKGDTLKQVLKKMDERVKLFKVEHSDLALPIRWAKEQKKKINVFVVYTDNVIGQSDALKALEKYRDGMKIPNAKLIIVAMAPVTFPIADSEKPDRRVMIIPGFDTFTPYLIEQFTKDANKYTLESGPQRQERTITRKSKDLKGEALLEAAREGNLDVVNALLEAKADIEYKDSKGNTALLLAVQEGKSDVVKILLENGASIQYVYEGKGKSALHLATKRGDFDIIKTLLEAKASIEYADRYGNSALLLAAQKGNNDIVKTLLGAGADIHTRNSKDNTALHLAAAKGECDVVNTLLKADAYIEYKDCFGNCALLLATQKGNNDIVKILLKEKADIDARDIKGDTAQVLALRKGNSDVFKMLLNAKTDNKYKDIKGDTAPVLALRKGNSDVFKMLLNAKTDTKYKDIKGDTAQVLALRKGNSDVFKMLLNAKTDNKYKDSKDNALLLLAARRGETEIVKQLLDTGADIEDKDPNGNTALLLATRNGNCDVVKILLQNGASIQYAEGKKKKSALHEAALKGHSNIVKILLEAHAEIEYKDQQGNTALLLATRGKKRDVVKILLAAKA